MDVKKGLGDFKRFLMRGNVIDLAVGVIVGSAFGKIVTSLVNDILMPVLGLITGQVNLTKLDIILVPKNKTLDGVAVTLNYGVFLQNIIDFLIIAASVYAFIKLMERFRRKQEKVVDVPTPTHTEELLTEIRDLLKEKK